MAARSLIQLFRAVNPTLLHKKDRVRKLLIHLTSCAPRSNCLTIKQQSNMPNLHDSGVPNNSNGSCNELAPVRRVGTV